MLFGADADFAVDVSQQNASSSGLMLRAGAGDLLLGRSLKKYSRSRGFGNHVAPWQYTGWIDQLFPRLQAKPTKPKALTSQWPADVKAISQQLVQSVTMNSGGLRLRIARENFDPRWNRTTSKSTETKYVSSKRWLQFSDSTGSQTLVNWCDEKIRGVHSRAFHLGQTRKAGPRDISSFRIGFRPHAETPLHEVYPRHTVDISRPADDRIVLVLTPPNKNSKRKQRLTIDTERNVILTTESLVDDKPTSQTAYSDFVQVGGAWWPQNATTTNSDGKVTSVVKLSIEKLNARAFAAQYTAELPQDNIDQLISQPVPTVKESKVAAAAGKATFAHQLTLLLSEMEVQQWDIVLKRLESLRTIATDKPGMDWIELAVLQAARKNDDARLWGVRLLKGLVDQSPTDELYLANYLLGQLGSVVDQNEMLSLLDQIEPVFNRQPEHSLAKRQRRQKRAAALSQLNRNPEALAIWRELSTTAPWNTNAAVTYARQLDSTGDFAGAKTWLRQRLDVEQYNGYEREQLRNACASMMRAHNATDELVTFLADWIAENPKQQSAYDQYLSAIMSANRYADANKQAQEWIDAGKTNEKLADADLVRLNAGVSFALGDRSQQDLSRIDLSWLKRMEQTALFFLEHEHHFDIATKIVHHYRFTNSDERDRVVVEATRRLKAASAELDPNVVVSYVNWTVGTENLTTAEWKAIANILRTRWDNEDDVKLQNLLANSLQSIYNAHFTKQRLPFMRDRIARAETAESVDKRRLANLIEELFNHLLSRDWSPEYETEALNLLTKLSGGTSKSQQLASQVEALHRFVDQMLASRFQHAMETFQANDQPEELTRTEYRAKVTEFRKAAQTELAVVLNEHVTKLGVEPNPAEKPVGQLTDWINLERMHLDVQLNQNLSETIQAAWAFMGADPVHLGKNADAKDDGNDDQDDDAARDQIAFEHIRQSFQQRALILLSNLAVRKSAENGLTDRLMAYIDAGITLDGKEVDNWKRRKLAILIALDQPERLERHLRQWIREDEYPATWQLMLGQLVAEQGKINEAIQLFESVKRDQKTLAPADYVALSKWYLVTDRQDDYREARVESFMANREWEISDWIRQQRQPWSRTDVPLPTELDKNVLFAFQALFKKSNQPGNYLRELRDFYTACRDFRLLKMVPDSVVGRTPQQVYHFLGSLDRTLLDELRNEATADEIMQRLVEVRSTAKSPIDKRACDLLEAMIECRSAQVLNQPGPHIDAAMTALKRAFERDWADGEVVQMAAFLDNLQQLKHATLNNERIRQLKSLLKMTKPGSDDNLKVAWSVAHAVYFSDKGSNAEKREALNIMEVSVREFEQVNPAGWPARVNSQTAGYVSLLKWLHRYSQAETVLKAQLQHPVNPSQASWLRKNLNGIYLEAFRQDGQVSLSGDDLYRNLLKLLLDQAGSSNQQDQSDVFHSLNTLFRTAHKKKTKTVSADLRSYAFTQFPKRLRADSNQYSYDIKQLTTTLESVLGNKTALQFLIARFEDYPKRFDNTYQSAWQQHGYSLARYRFEEKDRISKLKPRLLAIVLKKIRQDLLTQNHGHTLSIYQRYHRYFWKQKAKDFQQVAEDVLKQHPDSARIINRVALFLYNNLGKRTRAIEVMLTAHKKGLLNTSQQYQVCQWMHYQDRYAESISLLESLVADSPDTIYYRTMLMIAYGHSNRKEQMRTLLTETDTRFRKPGLWSESIMAHLAGACLENDLYQKCIAYYAEAIDLRQRTAPNRGIGDGTLSGYYLEQAKAFAALNKTIEAVDAGSAAIVSWGSNISQRNNTTVRLEKIITQANDLDSYGKYLDQQAEENGTDSPLIRKMVGKVYANRRNYKQALKHLQIAIELQPNDSETQEALISTYMALKDTDSAVNQMLAILDYDRHNLELYKRLAETLKDDKVESERALTSIVEAAPLEAEHHQALAELREAGNRWTEAISGWKHVARLRSLEPTGLINLAEAQIHEKQWTEAQTTLDTLNRTKWPSRFNNVTDQVRKLEQRISKQKKKDKQKQ